MNFQKTITTGLVQINNSFSGQNYLPYSIGCLQAYAEANASEGLELAFLPPIYKRMPITKAVEQLKGADVVGFSVYVWNFQISLEIARRLKDLNTDMLIVFGGPHVPDHAETFLREHSFINAVVHNEGERTFLNLLEAFPGHDWDDLTGISFIDSDGSFRQQPPTPRMRNLSELPSPFLNGMFASLMNNNPNENWICLWETNRGCPFSCTFCDWGSATSAKVTRFEMDRLYREMKWFVDHKIEYIFVCDANFGSQKRDIKIAKYIADLKHEHGYPQGFSVQNTKNATDRAYQTQKILSDAGLNKGVSLSMQSVDTVTLENIKRGNISLDTYFDLARRFTENNVETYSDLILGLPGETYDSFCSGIELLTASGQHNRIQFNNLSVLPNAEMGDPEYRAKYGMVTVRSEIINIHGQREELDDDVLEYQDLVVATASMPAEDWVKTRAFSWMAAFLYFDKVLQLPLLLLDQKSGLGIRKLIEEFLTVSNNDCPNIARVRNLFFQEAKSIQNGGPEYVYSKDWLGIYWPADEYAYIQLVVDGQLDGFFREALSLLRELAKNTDIPDQALAEAIRLNHELISQPFLRDDIILETEFDLLSFWQQAKVGKRTKLIQKPCQIYVNRSSSYYNDLQTWCREIVWWGNKKGAYLYNSRVATPEPQLAGHF